MYERYDQPMATSRVFWRRVAKQIVVAVVPLVLSLLVGWLGYMFLAHLEPIDAFLNAAMILGGMGPVDVLTDNAAKIFAGVYAVYSGVFFLVIAGVILAPFLHRVMHRLHLPADSQEDDADVEKKSGSSRAARSKK